MDKPNAHPHSHLFTVRVWKEEIGVQQSEWRGKVQLLSTGETRYFRQWTGLVPLLVALLVELDANLEINQQ